MADTMHSLYDGYNYVFENLASPLTRNWFLAGNPLHLFVILGSYLYFCISLGPRYMKDRKPYDLKNVLIIYNVFQIFISLYLFFEGANYVFFTEFNLRCQEIDDPNLPVAKRIANAVWAFYMVKLIDLLDTIFFVLRKSNRQITQLHLHHHTLMPIASWIAVTFVPGGQSVIVGLINSLVHAIMYTYYLLSGLGDEYKKYLWWKKYLTMLQLIQFIIIGGHGIRSLFYPCSFPVVFKILTNMYAVAFIHMFGKFYYQSYVITKKENNFKGKVKKI